MPCQTPLKQRPFRRTEVRRSETKERIRSTTHSDSKAIVTTPIYQPLQFRPLGPGDRGWSVGAMGCQFRLRSLPGGALGVQNCTGAVYSELMYAVTKMMCSWGPLLRELLPVLSGADACGRCERRPFPFIHSVAGDRDHSGSIRKTLKQCLRMFCRLSDIRLLLSEVIPLRISVNKTPAAEFCAHCRRMNDVAAGMKRE